MALALSQQTHACLECTPMEKLITFNMTCLWTFHTNSLWYLFLIMSYACTRITLNTCLGDKKLVLFTWIQCFTMKARIFNDHKS